jgi:hypothetical protein
LKNTLNMIRILFLLFPVLLISQATLIAQPGTWRSYLTPSRINDYMEYAGEVWVATDAGIFTLNPATGAVTGHLTKAAGGLPSNEIEAMAIHPQTMQPFIGTYDVAMAQLNTDGEWHSIEYPQFIVDQAQGDKVMTYCLQFDGQGRLWAGTSVGLLRYDNEEWTFFNQSSGQGFLRDVWSMTLDSEGAILAASHLLFKIVNDVPQVISPVFGEPFGDELFSYGDAKVLTASNGDVWFFTDTGRIGLLRDGEWEVFDPSEGLPLLHRLPIFVSELPNGHLSVFFEDIGFFLFDGFDWTEAGASPTPPDNPLIGAYKNGAANWLFTKSHVMTATESDTTAQPLYEHPFYGIPFLFKIDPQQALWALTDQQILHNLETGDTIQCRHNGQPLWASHLTFTPDGTPWLMSSSRLARRTPAGGWEIFNHTNSLLPEGASLHRFVADALGRIWVQTVSNGLFRFDGQEWKHYNTPPFSHFAHSLTAGAGGDIWFANYIGGQAQVSRFNGVQLEVFNAANSGLQMDYSLVLSYDVQTNRLWTGGDSNKAQYYDGAEWHTTFFPLQAPAHEWMRHAYARDGYAVVASSNRVLLYADGQWQEFNRENSPLSNGGISSIGLDAGNALWVSHHHPTGVDIYETGLLVSKVKNPAAPAIQLSAFPNPAGESLTLELTHTGHAEQALLRIFSADGRLAQVQSVALTVGLCRVEAAVSGLLPGVYFVQIETGEGRYTARFVKG